MEKFTAVLVTLAFLVGGILGAVPQVDVTKTVTGDCSQIQAQDGDSVTVNYEGTFDNGTIFDSSFARNEPFTFDLGDPQLIKGWNIGQQGACVGDELILKIPYSLGYGDAGKPPVIPQRTDLNFRIHVLAIKDMADAKMMSPTITTGVEGQMNSTGNATSPDDNDDDDDYDEYNAGNPRPYDLSDLLYKLQFLAIPVAVILFILVAYCIYTIEYPDRKIKFYRVRDHDIDGGINMNRVA